MSGKARFLSICSIVCLLLLVLFLLTCCEEIDEPLYGIWVNEEYGSFGQYVYNPDGTALSYAKVGDIDPRAQCQCTIEEKWTDGEGNTYYKVLENWDAFPYDELDGSEWYFIHRINPSGDVKFSVSSMHEYADEFADPIGRFHIHYLQKERRSNLPSPSPDS